jgi:TetR/AcrR family transcriptional repressor of nem operon
MIGHSRYFVSIVTKVNVRSQRARPQHDRCARQEWIGTLARPRAFDDDKVLDAAIACFWQRGLAATSVRDLATEMGINGPSLYNAFGDKRALFARALERYAERSMRSTIQRLEEELSPKGAIREFLRLLIRKSITDPDRRGCLIVNSALEVSPHYPELGGAIASYLDEIEAFFRRCLEGGQSLIATRPANQTKDWSVTKETK